MEAELKKREKKASSLARASNLKPKSKTATVTPTKNPKKTAKKVDFVPTSQIKTRSKSRSPPKRETLKLDEENWPTPGEASLITKKADLTIARDITPTKENPVSIDTRPKNEEQTKETTTVDRKKPILEQIKPSTKFQSFKADRTQTYLDASNKAYKKITKKELRRLNIAFDVEIKIAGPEDGARQEQALRTAITELLKEAQNVDPTFGIMAWRDAKALPTLFSAVGIQKEPYNVLIHYLRPPMRGRSLQSIQKGRNFKWRIQATFDSKPDNFIKTWNRMDSRRFFATDFPVQAENCWQVGFCMGSTEGQVTTKINAELEGVTGIKGIQASWQNIWQREVTPSLWKEAKKKATDSSGVVNNSVKHQWSPSALVIFVERREDLKPARKALYKKFGRNVTDSHGNEDAYPTWPGGAQMKFVPMAHRNMSKANVNKIGKRIKMHTVMKGHQVTFDTTITDPDMELECLKGQTVGEAILNIMTLDNKNPLFRHFKQDWYRDITRRTFSLVAHKAFEKEANQCALTLVNVLVDKYGDGILAAFKNGMRGLNNPHKTYVTEVEDNEFEIDLESDEVDKFMNNTVECMFSNLEIIDQTTSNPTQESSSKGDNSTIEMGASLAYTHYSDKTQNSEKTQQITPTRASQ